MADMQKGVVTQVTVGGAIIRPYGAGASLTPDLPVQNFGRGEAEKTVDHAAWVNDRQCIGDQVSDGDDEHQVRNAAIAVFQTEAFEVFA